MNKMKQSILLILLVLFVASCGVQYSADYPQYASMDDLMAKADLTLIAEVRDHEIKDYGDYRFDVYSIRINEIYKGDLENSHEIEIRYMLNEIDDLSIGQSYLFFLEAYDENVPPMALNVTQATYEINDDGSLTNVIDTDVGFDDILRIEEEDVLKDISTAVAYSPITA